VRFQCSYCGGETSEAHDTIEDCICGDAGKLSCGAGADDLLYMQASEGAYLSGLEGHDGGFELFGLFLERLHVGVSGETYNLEAFSVGAHDIEGLEAYAARRTQDGETALCRRYRIHSMKRI
jgi:hypothetical protein